MSKPKHEIEPKVQISLFVPKHVKKRIAQYCIDNDTNQTKLVTAAIVSYLDEIGAADPAADHAESQLEQEGAACDSMFRYGLFMATLTAEQRTIFKEHASKPGVDTMGDLVASLESSEEPSARALAARIRQAGGSDA